MNLNQTILVAEDQPVNRALLRKILSSDYRILEAPDGEAALETLRQHGTALSAVLLDLVMPVLDGYQVLAQIARTEEYRNIPVIAVTGESTQDTEERVLSLGAWDFVTKPYNPNILKFRLKNAIARSQLAALERIKYVSEHDAVTGLYNRKKFYDTAGPILRANPRTRYAFLRFDIENFKLINTFFGTEEGDKVLRAIADSFNAFSKGRPDCIYCHIAADVFCCCIPFKSKQALIQSMNASRQTLRTLRSDFELIPNFGVYLIEDNAMSLDTMYDNALMAAKKCKGSYVDCYAFYEPSMRKSMADEQWVTAHMNAALEQRQFEVYFQPKYDVKKNLPYGAEALVRWNHPERGMISPGSFIPAMERNGFISKLDYYVWEQVCRYMVQWRQSGEPETPVSVNVSRVNLYNPNLPRILLELTQRYAIAPQLLNLEITESVYTENNHLIHTSVKQLQAYGFVIMMDDFGSGYSSLNVLKDVDIDVLKIDMCFFSNAGIPGRAENIIASVVRMAKWLNLTTIAEGVEKVEQVDFLREIGCDYIQGYYFSRPMPAREYEQLLHKSLAAAAAQTKRDYNLDSLWVTNPQMELLFSGISQAVAIYEVAGEQISILRANHAFYDLYSYTEGDTMTYNPLNLVSPEYRDTVRKTLCRIIETKSSAECEYLRISGKRTPQWIRLNLKYISEVSGRTILLGSLTDISAQHQIEEELSKYRSALNEPELSTNQILIVDDVPLNRDLLRSMFDGSFTVFEASNGDEALRILEEHDNRVDLILLDLMMPVMDGKAFLEHKRQHKQIAGIPVIMITAEQSQEQQLRMLDLGVDDYVVKPFVKEIVLKRVSNILSSHRRYREILREYNNFMELSQADALTNVYNRASAEELIRKRLAMEKSGCALILADVDYFKTINDTFGHDTGDRVLKLVAQTLKRFWRSTDLVARFGGDEFCVMTDAAIPASDLLLRANECCRAISDLVIDGMSRRVTLSMGIAIQSDLAAEWETLYKNADTALYDAKRQGRDRAALFGYSAPTRMPDQHFNREWLVNELDVALFLIDCDTYEMLHASSAGLRLVEQKEYRGRTCYEVLHGRTTPCPFCIQHKLRLDAFYRWSLEIPNLHKTVFLKDKLVDLGGRKVHLQIAEDISNLSPDSPVSKAELR